MLLLTETLYYIPVAALALGNTWKQLVIDGALTDSQSVSSMAEVGQQCRSMPSNWV